jgi:hypothetical protein
MRALISNLHKPAPPPPPRSRILGRNPDKSLKSFPPCYSLFLNSFDLRFLFLHTHATSYSFCKGERRKTDRKPYPLHYGLRNPFRNLKPVELSRFCPETSMNMYVHELGFRTPDEYFIWRPIHINQYFLYMCKLFWSFRLHCSRERENNI